MAEITTPAAYFTQTVPQQYAAALAAAPALAQQPPLSAVFEITGDGGGTYSLRSAGGQLEVEEGDQIENPDLRVVMPYADWHVLAGSGASDTFIDFVQRGKVQVVQNLKGTVNLELTRDDGSLWHSTMVFGNQADPTLTMMMSKADYDAMLSGELNGQMAFLTGKLKFDGSLPLLMQIGALAS